MQLTYRDDEGRAHCVRLGEKPITIGRAADADIVISDERASRYHCGIRLWDGDYVIKDLRSRNATYVNEQPIEVAQIKEGDVIRIGATVFHCERRGPRGPDTAIREIADEMADGKGYSTLLREIVDDTEKQRPD